MFLCVLCGILMVLIGESPINNLFITAGKKEMISFKNEGIGSTSRQVVAM